MSVTSAPPTVPVDVAQVGVSRHEGPGEALRRYPLVALVPMLLLAVLGAVLSQHRTPTYTANAQVVVEPVAPSVTQLPAAVQSAEDLATNESRLLNADGVTVPLAKQFGVSVGTIANRLSATPIPGSTIIRVSAEAHTAASAVSLANAAAATFAHYVTLQVQRETEASSILKAYQASSVELARAEGLKTRVDRAKSSEATRARVAAVADVAQVRQHALATQYETFALSHGNAPTVKPFVLATAATSDRASRLEIYAFSGLVVGLLIGVPIAMLLANRRRRTRALGA
jgi:uncharacterized protein involved in exopolysaccharide biosynthesis